MKAIKNGKIVIIGAGHVGSHCGLSLMMQGLATEIVRGYLERERRNNRDMLILTCLDGKVKMYEKMGFLDRGISGSSWGGEEWHEMVWKIREGN